MRQRNPDSENSNFFHNSQNKSISSFDHYENNKIEIAEDDSIIETEKQVANVNDLIISSGMLVQGSINDPFEVYDYLKVLGEGSFGRVSKVIHRKLAIVRALKAIDKKIGGLISEEHQKKLIKEINILKSLDHPNIIKVYEYFDTASKLYIVTEYCSGGELFERILKMKIFSEKTVAHVMKQLLSAVNYCHLNNVIHRDLKPENILIESQADAKQEYFTIKIIDFGTSDVFRNRRNSRFKKFTEKIGSSYYIAPEVLNGNYDEKCDIWSCGVIMYMLLGGSPPFDGANDKEIFKSILNSELKFPENSFANISYEAKELLKFLLNRDVSKRFGAQQALDHSWFKTCESNKNADLSVTNKEAIDEKKLQKISENLRKFQTNQKLQQACIKYIVHNMVKKEEIEEYRKIFSKFDLNGDGRLSKEELIAGFSQTMSPAEAKMEVERLINDIDGDKNNFIEFEEFLSAFMDKEKLIKEENLTETFMLFDRDCSGKISVNEIKKIMGEGLIVKDEVWTGILQSIDSNSDGEISYKEFKEMMRKMIK
jgi:calcium-dependent protein kinase